MKQSLSLLLALFMLMQLLCGYSSSSSEPDSTASDPDSAAVIQHQIVSESASASPTEAPSKDALIQKHIEKILAADAGSSGSIDVDPLEQYPELPTGCESVALTIALNALGGNLDKTDVAEYYLRYDDDFVLGYCGDPFSDDGAGVMPPGIITTVENYVARTGAPVYAYNTSHSPLRELYKFIDAGCPVVMWTTYYMDEPMYTDDAHEYNGDTYFWYENEHCVTLYGYDRNAGTVDIADPLQGAVTVDADEFERINHNIGGWSVAIIDTSAITQSPTVAPTEKPTTPNKPTTAHSAPSYKKPTTTAPFEIPSAAVAPTEPKTRKRKP